MTMTTTQETNQIQLVTKISRADRETLIALTDEEYVGNNLAGYMVTADGKIITINKPRIQTSFWFGENGYDFQEKVELASTASRDREYFKQENIANSKLTSKQANIEAALDGQGKFFLFKIWGDQPFYSVTYFAKDRMLDSYSKSLLSTAEREMTRAELEAYKELIEAALKAFDRRLNTYLKRYGLSKCSYDTYWVDR